MTTSRIVRGTKGRIFLYICAILIITGIIACYNNTRIELENVQKSNELCHQQQENLSTQLQVISDYKQRLEKSLKTEKAEHQHAITELNSRLNEEKLHSEKSANDATLRFNSLQQHYNLLQTQHDDFKEECSKIQKEQLDEINNLQSKLKEIQGQLKQSEREKENSLEHLKSQLEHLKVTKENLEKQISLNVDKNEIIQLQKEIDELKAHCLADVKDFESLQAPVQTNLTEIQTDKPHIVKETAENKNDNNVADLPSNVGDEINLTANHVDASKGEKSVDNIGNDQNVLPMPNNKIDIKPSTPNSNVKSSSKAVLDGARPLKIPTVTPESKSLDFKSNLKLHVPNKNLPEGVVPVQNEHMDNNLKSEGDSVANFINNRYRNIVGNDKDNNIKIRDRLNDVQEKENGANEIFDLPINDNNNINAPAKRVEEQQLHKQHIDTLGIGGGKDKIYDGDYDKFPQNDANLEENEEDDDADDYGNRAHKEPAVRN